MAKKKIVKPTIREQITISRRLREKYPPRKPEKKEDWVSRLKGRVKAVFAKDKAKAAKARTIRTKATSDRLRKAGLTEKEIARLRGKK